MAETKQSLAARDAALNIGKYPPHILEHLRKFIPYISDHLYRHGVNPTARTIGQQVGVSSELTEVVLTLGVANGDLAVSAGLYSLP